MPAKPQKADSTVPSRSANGLARHAPAGRSIPCEVALGRAQGPVDGPWSDYEVMYFDSGTSSLAVAIRAALAPLIARGLAPVVVLPAYGCPDLLSATVWAGGQPEFIDYGVRSLAPDPERLLERLQRSDAVVVAVDSFGVDSLGARFKAALTADDRARLVHDLAQSYEPFDADWRAAADFNIVSFGRAKPVSLTCGGALVSRVAVPSSVLSSAVVWGQVPSIRIAIRSVIYNVSLHPLVFGTLARIPQLGIGQTHYSPLSEVKGYGSGFARFAAAAVREDRDARILQLQVSARMNGIAINAGLDTPSFQTGIRLWRMPILCSSGEQAGRFVQEFQRFGVSRLYGRTLPEFAGFDRDESKGRWPHATALAQRLVTLPTHGRLTEAQEQILSAGMEDLECT